MGFWETVFAGVVVFILGGVLTVAWQNKHKPGHWLAKNEGAAAKTKKLLAEDVLMERKKRVVEVARAKAIPLAASAVRHNPTEVTYADGSKSWHYSNRATYESDMRGGRTDRQRSFPGPFNGNPVSRWSKAEVDAWLKEHDKP